MASVWNKMNIIDEYQSTNRHQNLKNILNEPSRSSMAAPGSLVYDLISEKVIWKGKQDIPHIDIIYDISLLDIASCRIHTCLDDRFCDKNRRPS